jgi:hypothetical protein
VRRGPEVLLRGIPGPEVLLRGTPDPEVLLRGTPDREGARGIARGVCKGADAVFSRTFRLARRSRVGGIFHIIKSRRLL